MKDVQQLFSLSGIEIKTVTANKLQSVPLPGIVSRSDRNTAVRLQPLHCQLHARRRTNSEIDDFTTRCQQSGQNCRSNHRTRWPRVAANQNSSAIEIRPKAFGKLDRQFGGEGFTDDSPHAGDADFQRFHLTLELNNSGSWVCRT